MNSIKFLGSASEITEQIREFIRLHSSGEPIRIAVAFWGNGAEEIIRRSANQYQIICNLRSGGTNPDVVRFLAAQSNVSIVQLDTLHAKVLISDAGAVISSANFSINGLALEGINSQTWQEAGVVLPTSAVAHTGIVKWFERLWCQAKLIKESDLEQADGAWAQRSAMFKHTSQNQVPIDNSTNGIMRLRTIKFLGRAPMKQVYLRSAAALVALGGCAGQAMPASAFKFLFCGGTNRAFTHHESKFIEDNGSLKLHKDFIGYFVGHNGSTTTATNPGRLKSFSDDVVHALARWMLGEGSLPGHILGSTVEANILLNDVNR